MEENTHDLPNARDEEEAKTGGEEDTTDDACITVMFESIGQQAEG
jgi:hypothetical protein